MGKIEQILSRIPVLDNSEPRQNQPENRQNQSEEEGLLSKRLKRISETDETTDDLNDIYRQIQFQIAQEEFRERKLKNDILEGENAGDSQDRTQRKKFAEKIFNFVSIYMYLVFFVLILSGCENKFYLSDSVLITLLGTTTANVIGVLIIVVTYLFSRKKKK